MNISLGCGLSGMKKTILFVMPILAVVGWMLVIFLLSSQTAVTSNTNSKAAAEMILKATGQAVGQDAVRAADTNVKYSNSELEKFNLVLRKCSHSIAYFILAILILFATDRNHIKGHKFIFISFAICAVYAVTDEIHQHFVPGRSSAITDVMIDCVGGALGIVLYVAVMKGLSHRTCLLVRSIHTLVIYMKRIL